MRSRQCPCPCLLSPECLGSGPAQFTCCACPGPCYLPRLSMRLPLLTDEPRCRVCLHKHDTGLHMPRVLLCGGILCHSCIMKATEEDLFMCPYCRRKPDYKPASAPLASVFKPHPGLLGVLPGGPQTAAALPCQNCAGEDPKPAAVWCKDCRTNLCKNCDQLIHAPRVLQTHARAPVEQGDGSVPSLCPDHRLPIDAVCEMDRALMCASCHMQPGAPQHGHAATSTERSGLQLEQQLGTGMELLLAQCRGMATAGVEWKGQAAVADFLGEMQCALVEAEGEKTKMLVDTATALACRQMRASVARLKEEDLCALGQLSVASTAATVLAGKARKALQTKRTGDLVSCLSAVRLAEADALRPKHPAASIILLHYDATSSMLAQQCVRVCSSAGFSKGTIISCGWQHCVALKGEGSIVCWGNDEWQQCSGAPAGTGFLSVSAASGGSWSVALKSDGSLHSWGTNQFGQCGGTPSGTGFVAASAGARFGVAIRSEDGTLVAWGDDEFNQISDLPTGSGFVEVSAGHSFGVARKADGSLVAWGMDQYHQVTSTTSGTGYTSVAAGTIHAVAIRGDGSLVSWGNDAVKQCTGTPPGTGFKQVAAGWGHSLALKQDGSLVSWGDDGRNQVSGTPTGTGFCWVSDGDHCSIALRDDGSLASWGGGMPWACGQQRHADIRGTRGCISHW
eukprot:gene12889-biopygen3831